MFQGCCDIMVTLLCGCFSYFFLEFSTAEEAVNAVKTGNGYRFDKNIFKVNFFSDFEK